MTDNNKTHIKKSRTNQLGGHRPKIKRLVGSNILSGLCVAAVLMIFSTAPHNPLDSISHALHGNDISLHGNGVMATNYDDAFNVKLTLDKYRDNGYYGVLSKTQSGRANRRYLAFYVTDSGMDSQIHSNQSDTAHKRFKRQWGSTLIKASNLPNLYDGTTSLNKIAERRISGAATLCAESESCHPIFTYSVIPTQKHKGAIHHG